MNSSEFEIPKRLHSAGRKENQDFSKDNVFYRRVPPDCYDEICETITPSFARDFHNLSVCRDSFCEFPEDVLYDAKQSKCCENWGIIAIKKEIILNTKKDKIKNDNDGCEYSLTPKHMPEEFQYPHCEIWFKKSAEIDSSDYPKRIGSPLLKTKLKEFYRVSFEIIKKPILS